MPAEELFSAETSPVGVNIGITDPVDETFQSAKTGNQALEGEQKQAVEDFVNKQANKLDHASQQLGSDFRNELQNILDVARILKAETNGKDFSTKDPRSPSSGQLGINMLLPKDIEQPAGTTLDTFDLTANGQSITAGQDFYWWGGPSDTDYVTTTDPSSGNGYLVYIINNGIGHFGETPVANQFEFSSAETTPSPFVANVADRVSVDPDRSLTRYETDGAYLLNWQVGNNLKSVATRDVATALGFGVFGVVVYEQGYYNSLHTW